MGCKYPFVGKVRRKIRSGKAFICTVEHSINVPYVLLKGQSMNKGRTNTPLNCSLKFYSVFCSFVSSFFISLGFLARGFGSVFIFIGFCNNFNASVYSFSAFLNALNLNCISCNCFVSLSNFKYVSFFCFQICFLGRFFFCWAPLYRFSCCLLLVSAVVFSLRFS